MEKHLGTLFLVMQLSCILFPNEVRCQWHGWPCVNAKVCSCAGNQVECDGKNLEEIPSGVPLNTSFLTLRYNNLTKFQPNSFCRLTKLKNLIVSWNLLREIDDGSCCNHTSLLELDLSRNKLREVKKSHFQSFTSVHNLSLQFNQLEVLSQDVFHHLTNLVLLNLASNHLKALPQKVFDPLENLYNLNLSSNYLKALPQNVFDPLENLYYLSLSHNKLIQLPRWILRKLLSLQTLDISHNKLEVFPTELYGNNYSDGKQRLETILLQGNQLTYLEKNSLRDVPNTTSLYLYHNKISYLADNTFMGANVKYIYLYGNSLSTLNTGAFQNSNFQEIHLYENKIQNVTWDALGHLNLDARLYLSCTFFNEINAREVNLVCVHDDFVPSFNVIPLVGYTLAAEGFKCTATTDQRRHLCVPCKRGTYLLFVNFPNCQPCPAGGFYQDEIGAFTRSFREVACKRCSKGTYVKEEGASEITMCKMCPDGTDKNSFAGINACPCLDKYARTDRFGNCTICLEQGIDCRFGQDHKSIKYGYFWSWDFPNADVQEYIAFAKENSLEYHLELPKPHKCPRQNSCNNTEDSIEVECATGYKGWLCGTCSKSYYEVMGNCIPCPNTVFLIIEVLVIMCLLLVVCFVICRQHEKRKRSLRKGRRSNFNVVISRSKIVLGFYQVVGEYLESFQHVTCAPFIIVGEFISLIQMNFLKILVKPQCLNENLVFNPKVNLIVCGGFTLLLLIIAAMMYIIKRQCYKYTKDYMLHKQHMKFYLRNLKSKILSYVVILMFITYPPMCTAVFQLYPQSCETFSLDEKQKHSITVLRADYEIHCENIKVYQICAYVLTVGYVLAFPTALYILLRKYAPKASLQNSSENISLLESNDQHQDTEPLLNDSSEEVSTPIWLEFLCENYKPQFWYWEIVELARKVTQTVLITLLGFQHKQTVLVTIAVSILFLVLHARLMPMKNKFEQNLQMFVLITILINLQVAAIEIPVTKCDSALSITLTVLNGTVIFIMLAEFTVCTIRYLKRINLKQKIMSVFAGIYEKVPAKSFRFTVRRSMQTEEG